MKTLLILFAVFFAVVLGICDFRAGYQYNNTIGSYWNLSDKASTLQQKSVYLDQYVEALETAHLASHDAVMFPTPNNSEVQNMIALKSLQGRMHQIQGMDEQSFAYQTAISQITAQEQGEAHELTDTLRGCWFLENWPLMWGWYNGLAWIILVVLPIAGTIIAGILKDCTHREE